jgi:hypothetical protein
VVWRFRRHAVNVAAEMCPKMLRSIEAVHLLVQRRSRLSFASRAVAAVATWERCVSSNGVSRGLELRHVHCFLLTAVRPASSSQISQTNHFSISHSLKKHLTRSVRHSRLGPERNARQAYRAPSVLLFFQAWLAFYQII